MRRIKLEGPVSPDGEPGKETEEANANANPIGLGKEGPGMWVGL